jgi:hypothetical protein
MIMCSADDTSGENIGGSEPRPGVPVGSIAAEAQAGTNAGGKAPARDPHDLAPYLALVISTYGATKSIVATAVAAAVMAVIALVVNRRYRVLRPGRNPQETWPRFLTPGRQMRPR